VYLGWASVRACMRYVHEVRVGGHGHGLPVLEERPGGDAHCEPLPLEGVRQQGPGVAAERAVARDQVGQALARDFPKVVHERLESLAQDLSPEKVEPLDLGRALPHRRDPHVAVHLFGPIVLDITVTAVDFKKNNIKGKRGTVLGSSYVKAICIRSHLVSAPLKHK